MLKQLYKYIYTNTLSHEQMTLAITITNRSQHKLSSDMTWIGQFYGLNQFNFYCYFLNK